MALRVTEDQSIEDEQGRVLFYSADRFLRDVAERSCCFICGAVNAEITRRTPGLKEFVKTPKVYCPATDGASGERSSHHDRKYCPANDKKNRKIDKVNNQLSGLQRENLAPWYILAAMN